jgi:hypothetical protein
MLGNSNLEITYVRFKAIPAVTLKKSCSGMLRCVALVRTDVSGESSAYIIRLIRIGGLGT